MSFLGDKEMTFGDIRRIFRLPVMTHVLVVLGFLIVGGGIYSNTLNSSFQFDDEMFVVQNPSIRQISDVPGILRAFNTRFVLGLTFALNYRWDGLNVFGYHLTNLIIHLANAILLYILLLKFLPVLVKREQGGTFSVPLCAALAAGIFLVHPLQTQAVTYISQRATSLVALFYLATVLFYVLARMSGRRWCYLGAWVTALLGMFTKENMATLPLALLLVEVLLGPEGKMCWRARGLRLLPFFAIALILPMMVWFERSSSIIGFKEQLTVTHFDICRLWTAMNVFLTYARIFVLPVSQNIDYDYPMAQSFWSGYTPVSFLAIAVAVGIAFGQYSRNRIVAFGIGWFFVTTLAEFGVWIWTGRDMIYEHWLYLPLVGYAVLVAWAVCRFAGSRKKIGVISVGLLSVLCLLTYARNQVWRDPLSLWQDVVRKSPNKSRGYDNLGAAYIKAGQYEIARGYIEKALELGCEPACWKSYNNLGLILLQTGRPQEAVPEFERALQTNSGSAEILTNLGVAYFRQEEFDRAEEKFKAALALEPLLIEPKTNLAAIYKKRGDFEGAIKLLQEAYAQDPHNEKVLFLLAEVYSREGDKSAALVYGKQFLREGRNPQWLTLLGSLFAFRNFSNLGMALLEKSVAVDPQYPDAYLELGKIYGNREMVGEAIKIWQEGAKRAPEDPRFLELINKAQELFANKK